MMHCGHVGMTYGCSACAKRREMLKRGGQPSKRDILERWIAARGRVRGPEVTQAFGKTGELTLLNLVRTRRVQKVREEVPPPRAPRQKSFRFWYSCGESK